MNSFINMQMAGPRAVQNLQMPHPWDSQGGQMPCSGSLGGGGGGAGRSWNWLRHYASLFTVELKLIEEITCKYVTKSMLCVRQICPPNITSIVTNNKKELWKLLG